MCKIETFGSRKIRTIWNEDEKKWCFVILDVVKVLANSVDHYNYTKKLRKYDLELGNVWSQLITPLKVYTTSGIQKMNCADALGIFRIIISIRSQKAKLFIKWLQSLQIDPFEKYDKIKFSKKEMNEFYETLNNKDNWIQKGEQILLINKKQPSTKRLNDLELIFVLLEEDDILSMRDFRENEIMEARNNRPRKSQNGILPKRKLPVYYKDYKPGN